MPCIYKVGKMNAVMEKVKAKGTAATVTTSAPVLLTDGPCLSTHWNG